MKKEIRKFDACIMNPPYQANTKRNSHINGSRTHIWDKFVEKGLALTKEGCYMAMIHPAGWRRPSGKMREVGAKIKQKQVEYLEIHNIQDGKKTFGVCTRYDWYILHNVACHKETIIRSEDGVTQPLDISQMEIIPNGKYKEILPLLSNENKVTIMSSQSAYETRKEWMEKDKITIINDRSNYGHDKIHMSKTKNKEYIYPCVYITKKSGTVLLYSKTNKNGHFGTPKVIFSNGAASKVIIDEKGQYGLTQFAYGIVDSPKNLPKIKKALESPEFIEICKYMRFTLDRYDVGFISCLRKDFWKFFTNEKGEKL